ncbi:MAG TPA: sigma-70 family RNA polymerase sigma factor [Pyrinomonadaceae bacterium]|nr:sigma-70 family RNA polymerase sigma factor [Pyrinomonadaceae bacterium]
MSAENAAIHDIRPIGRAKSNEWTLTTEAFEKLLSYLDPNYELAAEKYVTFHSKLLKFFEWRGCLVPDMYVDETLNRVTRKIEQGTVVDNFQGFLYGVAKNVLREALKQDSELKTSVDAGTFVNIPGPEPEEQDCRLECIEVCLLQLPPEGRKLLLAYYETGHSLLRHRRELARQQGVSLVTLRVQVHRLRRTLEGYVSDCMKHHREEATGKVLHIQADKLCLELVDSSRQRARQPRRWQPQLEPRAKGAAARRCA